MSYHRFIDPWRFTKEHQTLNGKLENSLFSRLNESVHALKTAVSYKIDGEVDSINQPIINGDAQIDVELICQRCLEPFLYTLRASFTWIPVHNEEEAEEKDENCHEFVSAILVENNSIDLINELEDELLLALPIIARHTDQDHCNGKNYIDNAIQEEKIRPFSQLAELLNKKP